MITVSPVRTFKRIVIVLTACMLQLASNFVFALDDGATALGAMIAIR